MGTTFANLTAHNRRRPCDVKGCRGLRFGMSHYCCQHRSRLQRLGHPTVTPIRRAEFAPYRAEVESLLQANESHPGLLQVLTFLDGWMVDASLRPAEAFKGAPEIARLRSNGITPRTLLVEFLAASVFLHERGSRMPTDKASDYALSRAVFALVPRSRRAVGGRGPYGNTWGMPTNTPQSYSPKALPSDLAHVGRFLRQSLAVFTVNVIHGVEVERKHKADPLADYRTPLQAPSRLSRSSATGTTATTTKSGALPFPVV